MNYNRTRTVHKTEPTGGTICMELRVLTRLRAMAEVFCKRDFAGYGGSALTSLPYNQNAPIICFSLLQDIERTRLFPELHVMH